MAEAMRRELGHYVVADPKICHGQPTFSGTRILVKDVLAMVADGMAWAEIVRQWDGRVPTDAIAEAVRLASEALAERQPAASPA
jgi:uncharacterized protein (DUF433 family)